MANFFVFGEVVFVLRDDPDANINVLKLFLNTTLHPRRHCWRM